MTLTQDENTHDESTIQQRLFLPIDTAEYDEIRKLWIHHSKSEDARDLDGLISTLSETCVYEIVPTGQRWEGHNGARTFYLTFLGAFPDVHFDLQEIVVGPQGVMEVTRMTGTHKGEWAGLQPTGKHVELDVVIYFPWNPIARKFDGERVWFDRKAMELE